MWEYRNAEHAFVGALTKLVSGGSDVTVRGHVTRELTNQAFTLREPLERCITVRGRNNSLAATIAETMWVLAGRNDIDFMKPYLPRAAEFSDDGEVWRGGYGPRLRNWRGVDQLAKVRELLLGDPLSRRAVISLFDPATDFADTLDVPCNNWLHFLRRGEQLDLSIAVRSNDVMWGFSGINAFEWSVLHELLAKWIGASAGRQHWFITSLHLYDHHFARAEAIQRGWTGLSAYQACMAPVGYRGTWDGLPSHLAQWFETEALVRTDPEGSAKAVNVFPEPMFRSFLHVLRAHWLLVSQGALADISQIREPLAGSDLGYAVDELASRRGVGSWEPPRPKAASGLAHMRERIAALHAMKSAAYGDSWKRRGELFGVLANIARKIDRIENSAALSSADPESFLDTLVDLYIYLLKYETFLADQDHGLAWDAFGADMPGTKSDGLAAFEHLLYSSEPAHPAPDEPLGLMIEGFARLHRMVESSQATPRERFALAEQLSGVCLAAILEHAEQNPHETGRFTSRP